MGVPQSTEQVRIFRLRAITGRLKSILLDATQKQFWVRAQLVPDKVNRMRGHFYGELADIDEDGRTVAKMRAVIWRGEYERIKQKLADDGQPDALNGNREICALCAVRFHEVYGLQLQVFDVDPNFGESHIERNRYRILQKLRAEGLLERNKTTTLVRASLRIGLVTSANTAAYADFTKTLGGSPYAFKILLAASAMQGQMTSAEVVAAISSLIQAQVDVICLVRGGGSPLDLAWFDDEAIARAIAHCPVPVWVGIGHEIDVTVPDFVAHTSHKTPTAVAETLIERIRSLDKDLAIARERLVDACNRELDLAQRSIGQYVNGLLQGARKHLEIYSERFLGQVSKLEASLEARMSGQVAHLGECSVRLHERVRARTEVAELGLENAGRRVEEGIHRHLQQAEVRQVQSLNGLVQGTRKHLGLHEERFHRRATMFRGVVERVFDTRLGRLATKAVRLQGKLRANCDLTERDLKQRQEKVLAAFERVVDGRLSTLALKTSRFSSARYERILDQMLNNLEEKKKRVDALSPEKLLARGYSLTRDERGHILRSVDEVKTGQTIYTQLAKGELASIVTKKEDNQNDRER
jgi:exodeoxyribonuclease VII large subunit